MLVKPAAAAAAGEPHQALSCPGAAVSLLPPPLGQQLFARGEDRRWDALDPRWGRGFPSPPAEQPRADELLPRSGRMSRCVSFRKGLPKHPITVSLPPVSLPSDAFCHCVKQPCPEATVATATCFNGDSSLAQRQVPSCKHSCSPHPTARWSSGAVQSICRRAGAGSQHCRIPLLVQECSPHLQFVSLGHGTPKCL